jgi:hypothetical protein
MVRSRFGRNVERGRGVPADPTMTRFAAVAFRRCGRIEAVAITSPWYGESGV